MRWKPQLIAKAGRIDALADLGAGAVVAGLRGPNAGQIWRSADCGATWALVQNIGADIATMAYDRGSGRAYALTGAGALWLSTDDGLSWAFLVSVTSGASAIGGFISYGLAVLPSGTVLVASTAADGQIFRSTDGGVSFSAVATFPGVQVYRLQVVGDGVLANTFNGVIYRSTLDGMSWGPAINVAGAAPLYAVEYLGDNRVLLGSAAGTIYRSTDNGENWARVVTVDDEADDFVVLDDGLVLMSTYTGQRNFYTSHDNGVRWRKAGPVVTTPGDHLDHVIGVDTPAGRVAVGGTFLGYIVSCAHF